MIQAGLESRGWKNAVRDEGRERRLGQRVLGRNRDEVVLGEMGTRERQANCSWQRRRKAKRGGMMIFGSETGVVVTLASLPSVVASLSVAVPLVLSALSPALVVVTPVTVSSPGCRSKKKEEREY